MKLAQFLLPALLLAALTLVFANPAHAFTIRGTLENGTTGAKDLSGTVVVVNPAGGMLQEQQVQARNGRFEITGLDPQAPIYLLRIDYQGIPYNLPIQVTGADQDVALIVYEPTSSWEGIRVAVPHLAASRAGDRLRVEQLYDISNESSPQRTATGDTGFFNLYLPADVETVLACFVSSFGVPVDRPPVPTSTPGRYRIEYPIRPGITRIGLAYELPYPGASYTLNQTFYHPIEQITVFGVDPAMKVTSPSHTLTEMEPVHGMSAFSLANLARDVTLVLRFEGGDLAFAGGAGEEGQVEVAASDAEMLSWFVVGGLVVLFAGLVGLAMRERPHPLSETALHHHYDTVVARIARLDDLHAAGAIPEDAYRAARDELLARAAALAVRMRAREEVPAATDEPPAPTLETTTQQSKVQ